MSEENNDNRIFLGVAITLFSYCFFSAVSALVWNFQGRFPTIQIVFIQSVVSFFCILPIALRHGWDRLKTNHLNIHLMRDLFGIVSYYLYFLAIRHLNLVDATTLNYTAPFFVPIIWWIWTKEKVESHIWWAIVVGFIGVATILQPTKEIFQIGFVFGLFAGITSAIALVSVRMVNLKKEPMSRTLFYYFSISALLTFPFAWATWVPPTPYEWLLCILIGGGTGVAQILLTVAYRYGTASYLSPLGYMVVIYNALISYFYFQQPLGWSSLIGTALIIIGGTMTYLLKKKPHSIKQSLSIPKPGEKPPL